jgi:predicted  nucleic acid-binding Zn-ribbon protein
MTRAERDDIRDRIDDARTDIEEVDADWAGMVEELREIRERMAAAKVAKAAAKARLAELRALLRPAHGQPSGGKLLCAQ